MLDVTKLKTFADEKINVFQMMISVLYRVENILGKGENAGYQHFLVFPQCFQKSSFLGSLKVGIVCFTKLEEKDRDWIMAGEYGPIMACRMVQPIRSGATFRCFSVQKYQENQTKNFLKNVKGKFRYTIRIAFRIDYRNYT